jgi:hypothetical protein
MIKQLYLPESMGRPKENQLTGTIHENLGELASRICYDSLGSGRSSEALHQHILDVRIIPSTNTSSSRSVSISQAAGSTHSSSRGRSRTGRGFGSRTSPTAAGSRSRST